MPSNFRTVHAALVAAPALALLVFATILVAAPHARGQGGPSGAETIGVTIPPSGGVVCTRAGHKLPGKATVHHHDRLHCTANGFRPNEPVEIAVHSPGTVLDTVPADSHGVVTYDYTVGDDLAAGEHTLSFTGQASTTVAIYTFVVAVGRASSGGGGPGPGGAGPGGAGPGGAGPGGGRHGGLALTGTNLLALVLAGLGLIGMGIALHRRRLEREAA